MDLNTFLFWTIASLTGLCAIAVVVAQNIVRCAIWLLFTLAGTAGIFFLLGADFVGATQLLVYVGGTLVLVVFGVMLTAQGPFISMTIGAAEWAIATVVGLLLYAVLAVSILARPEEAPAVPPGPVPLGMEDPARSRSSEALGLALLNVEEATPRSHLSGMPAASAPERKRLGYLLPFEIVSVHLLVVLIGAAYLARAKRRRGAPG
jgi:NADH-quinone oxidoreductase subunit J